MDIEAPQGIYGTGAHPLEKAEVWVQHVELLGLSAQAGLGKGVDIAVAYAGVTPHETNFLTSEFGFSAPLSRNLHVRVTAGGGATLDATRSPDGSRVEPMGMLGGGLAWGARECHVALSTRATRALETWLLVSEVDAVLPAGRYGSFLLGLGDVIYLRADGYDGHALFAGPAYRHRFGAFTIDLGVQGAFGPSVHRPDALGPLPVVPVPTLIARYGWRGDH